MGFDQFDSSGVYPGGFICSSQSEFFSLCSRREDPFSPSVAGRTDALNYRINSMTVSFRILSSLEHHHTQALTQHRSVCILIERA